jgi:hypothetical protein
MSDKPREWPNRARWARDLAAEDAQCGIMALETIVLGERLMTESETLRRVATALNCLQRIVRTLESVGAQTEINER